MKKSVSLGLAMLFVMTTFTGCLSEDETTQKEKFIIAYEVKEDYDNPDDNPQVMADYLAKESDIIKRLMATLSDYDSVAIYHQAQPKRYRSLFQCLCSGY